MLYRLYSNSCLIVLGFYRQKNELEVQLSKIEGSTGDHQLLLESMRKEVMSLQDTIARQEVSLHGHFNLIHESSNASVLFHCCLCGIKIKNRILFNWTPASPREIFR